MGLHIDSTETMILDIICLEEVNLAVGLHIDCTESIILDRICLEEVNQKMLTEVGHIALLVCRLVHDWLNLEFLAGFITLETVGSSPLVDHTAVYS